MLLLSSAATFSNTITSSDAACSPSSSDKSTESWLIWNQNYPRALNQDEKQLLIDLNPSDTRFDEFSIQDARAFARMYLAGFVDFVPCRVWDRMEEMAIWNARVQYEIFSTMEWKVMPSIVTLENVKLLGGANDKLDATPTTPPCHL